MARTATAKATVLVVIEGPAITYERVAHGPAGEAETLKAIKARYAGVHGYKVERHVYPEGGGLPLEVTPLFER